MLSKVPIDSCECNVQVPFCSSAVQVFYSKATDLLSTSLLPWKRSCEGVLENLLTSKNLADSNPETLLTYANEMENSSE